MATIFTRKEDDDEATLKIEVREGWKRVEIPFILPEVKVGK